MQAKEAENHYEAQEKPTGDAKLETRPTQSAAIDEPRNQDPLNEVAKSTGYAFSGAKDSENQAEPTNFASSSQQVSDQKDFRKTNA